MIKFVSIATCSHHRVIIGKLVSPGILDYFDKISLILAGNHYTNKLLDEIEMQPDPTTDGVVSCP